MHAKGALPVLAILAAGVTQMGVSQTAQAAVMPQIQTVAEQTVLHHSVASQAQQRAADTGLQRAAHARISVQQAIALAARQTNATIVRAGFVMRDGTPVYSLRAVSPTSIWFGQVNADNGALTCAATAVSPRSPELTQLGVVRQVHVPIEGAILRAETTVGGHVLNAQLEDVRGRPAYEMQLVKGDRVQNVVVDANAGTVQRLG